MTDYQEILSKLSPEKRKLFELRLKQQKSENKKLLSLAQKRLWFLEQLEPGNIDFNIPTAVELKGEMNYSILKSAFDMIIERHEILRTKVKVVDDEPTQEVEKKIDWELEHIDFSQILDSVEQNEELRRLLAKKSKFVFELEVGKLFRVTLIKLDDQRHVLLIVMHHIITDGWSVGIFIKELSIIYTALLNKSTIVLPELSIQYSDYAKWQNKWLESEEYRKLLEFWQKQLGTGSHKLNLPKDRLQSVHEKSKGNILSEIISSELVNKIRTLTKQNNVTLFMFFAAIIKTFLYKYTMQNDISIGTPVANRNKKQTHNLLGFFVNLVVLRSQIKHDQTFLELLKDVRKNSLDAFEHQEMPFELLVEEIQPERDLTSTPLFNVMYSFSNKSNERLKLPNLELSKVDIDFKVSQYELTFNIHENENNEVVICFEYSENSFTELKIYRLLNNFHVLLNSIISSPESKLGDISFIGKKDEETISINNLNQEKIIFSSIISKFEKTVITHHLKTAIKFHGTTLTYSELNSKINKLARYILDKQKLSNSLIGVFFDNSIEHIVSILAVLKSNNSFVPIDVKYPTSRVNKIIESSDLNLIITSNQYSSKISDSNCELLIIDNDLEEIDEQDDTNLAIDIEPNAISYCIFTSGSTGVPKGVLVNHSNLSNFAKAAKELYNIQQNDRILQFASPSFDTSIEEIFSSIISGSTLVVKTEEMLTDASSFIKILEEEKISILDLPSAYWAQLTLQMIDENIEYPNSIREIIIGGEKANTQIFFSWHKRYGNKIDFVNGYGPTETTVLATAWKYSKNNNININGEIPIGKILRGYSAFVLDDYNNLLPVGSSGELYIGGEGVGLGYLNDPTATAENFIPNPFSKIKGSRLYKTGDLVKLLDDGNIEYIDRKDNQVKIRGFRVELGEISSVLNKFPQIKDNTVLVKNLGNNDNRICAYLISDSELKDIIVDIRKFVKDKLPIFMIPSSYFQIKKIPLTVNGKVDEEKLLSLENELLQEIENERELSFTEKKVITILKELLKNDSINITDNFFEVGGHSLIATQLTGKIRKEFQVDYPVRSIFEAIDISDIARSIEKLNNTSFPGNEIPVLESRENFPLSFAQQRLWFLDQIEPNSSFYNIPIAVRLKGEFNLEFLKESIREVVQRHEILRTTFHQIDGIPIQKVNDNIELSIEIKDYSNLEGKYKEEQALEFCISEMNVGFSLNKLPLFRISFILMGENDFIIVTNIHHIISDGWSTSIFIKEISTIYQAKQNDFRFKLPEMKINYGDYSYWQRDWLKREQLEKRISFWKDYLKSAPTILNLPLDKKRPSVQTYNGAIAEIELETFHTQFQKVSTEEHTTSFMFFLTTFYILLYRLTNQEDIIIGTPIANREIPEIQNLIGLFVNTIALRGNLSGNPTFIELLRDIKKSTIEAFDNKDLPFEKILDSIDIDRNVSFSPLFQVMFTFNHFEKGKNKIEGLDYEEFNFKSSSSKFDLSITVQETENRNYICAFEYNTDLYNKETIDRWMNYYQVILNEIVINPSNHLLNYQLSDQKPSFSQNIILSKSENVIAKIKEHSIGRSNRIALAFDDVELTYSDLENYSNYLAITLIKKGISPGQYVGIYLDRSIESILGLLAIMKVGAAFIPLDTKYPLDRLEYIIEDSNLKYIVTNSSYRKVFPDDLQIIELNNFHDLSTEKSISEHFLYNCVDEYPAYVIYTSGTSGKPKGVLIPNYSLNSFVEAACNDYQISENDIVLQFASLSFDTCLEEILPILSRGGKLVLRNEEFLTGTEYFLQNISERKITILDLPTAFWHQLTNDMISNSFEFHSELHTIIIGGEKASKEIFFNWEKLFGNSIKLLNTYGPTEATVVSAFWSSQNSQNIFFNELPIGKSLANSETYVLDNEFCETPVGVVGELYLGGNGLAYGYLNDSSKTAVQFVPNSFSNNTGSRLYKTGDLVRRLPHDNIEFVGRVDSQVKIRGFRVELTEIENVVNKSNLVQQVAVVNNTSSKRDKLVCFYTSASSKELSSEDFTKVVKSKLPDYMIPANYVKVDKIPLTSSGKVDRRDLASRVVEHIKSSKKIVSPSTENENILFNVWQDILGISYFGVTDNFFELGGDSIIGIQVISKARQNGLLIKPVQLFQYQTIREIAAIVVETTVVNAEQGLVTGNFPYTPIQENFFNTEYINRNHWNQSVLFKINQK
ncbi:MAG: amino acid adenylation domain-containing protein, partial [Ignavibacteriae bacterium]|nr:amino acid adenylation domain-containing protein [Ignavibacteriota bacterium]